MNTEEIIWSAIKDIEDGNAFLISKDPLNGYLEGKNTKLTKMNVSHQTSKYTTNGKPISRPTIDSYEEIVEYINNKKNTGRNDLESLKKKNQILKDKNDQLEEMIKQIKSYSDGVALENLRLTELLRKNKSK